MKPITPEKAMDFNKKAIPWQVIESFNQLIKEKIHNGAVTLKQDEVVKMIMHKMGNKQRHEIFESGWLNVEELFKEAGWTVIYDKPGIGEGQATYQFIAPKKEDGNG